MIDAGKAYCTANKQFMNGIRDLAQYSSKDKVIEVSNFCSEQYEAMPLLHHPY